MEVFVPVLLQRRNLPQSYNVFFPAALAFAHLALAIAASLALTAGLVRRSAFLAAFGAGPLTLAHLALAPAAIRARAAADMRRFFGAAAPEAGVPALATTESSCPFSFSIRSLIAMTWLSWRIVRSERFVMGDW
jgi:hypothetical protein